MRTMSGLARLVRASILHRSISRTGSASTARGTSKGTEGGLAPRRRFSVRDRRVESAATGFDTPLFDGDNGRYAFLQFQVMPFLQFQVAEVEGAESGRR